MVANGTACPNFSDPGNAISFNYNSLGSTTTNCIFTATVSDGISKAQASTAQIIVNLPFSDGISVSSNVIDLGQTVTLTEVVHGGTLPYHYQFMISNAIDKNPLYSTNVISNTMIGNYLLNTSLLGNNGLFYANVVVIDSATIPLTVNSVYVTFKVNPALTVPSVNAAPSTINPGDTANLSASASGGTGTYTYTWYEGSTCTGTALSSNTVSPSSTTTYCVLASDGINNVTGTTTVTVNAPSGGGIINSGGEGGGGGGGGGGSKGPTITRINTTTEDGWMVSNYTNPESVTLTIGNTTFTITLNFITLSDAGVTINGVGGTLPAESLSTLPGGYYITLDNISYLPILHSISLTLYQVPLAISTATSSSSSTSSTTSASSSTASTTQTTITLVQATNQSKSGSAPPEVLIENELLVCFIIAVAFLLACAGISARRRNKGGETPTPPPAAT
jgi:hypothetical protein